MIPKLIQDYFTFTKKERIAVISLMAMLMVIFTLPHFIPARKSDISLKDVEAINKKTVSRSVSDSLTDGGSEGVGIGMSETRFRFDPNTLDISGWVSLGVPEKTAHTIRNYISKGGQFRQPSDLMKVYGLTRQLAEDLIPYVAIPRNSPGYSKDFGYKSGRKKYETAYSPGSNDSFRYKRTNFRDFRSEPKRSISIIDIATADSAAFESLPGIGGRLAMRLISFREKLGGFYTIAQVSETFGLSDSTFQIIKPYLILSPEHVRKISINTAGSEALKNHPYIRWNLANAIIAYRQEHGPFTDFQDLHKIALITPEIFARILPYLEL